MAKDLNTGKNSQGAGEELRAFIERVEHLEAEKKDVAEQIKEVFAEIKGRGYEPKYVRKIIAERKRDADDLAEEESVLDMYRAALGMGGGGSAYSMPQEEPEAESEDDDANEMV